MINQLAQSTGATPEERSDGMSVGHPPILAVLGIVVALSAVFLFDSTGPVDGTAWPVMEHAVGDSRH